MLPASTPPAYQHAFQASLLPPGSSGSSGAGPGPSPAPRPSCHSRGWATGFCTARVLATPVHLHLSGQPRLLSALLHTSSQVDATAIDTAVAAATASASSRPPAPVGLPPAPAAHTAHPSPLSPSPTPSPEAHQQYAHGSPLGCSSCGSSPAGLGAQQQQLQLLQPGPQQLQLLQQASTAGFVGSGWAGPTGWPVSAPLTHPLLQPQLQPSYPSSSRSSFEPVLTKHALASASMVGGAGACMSHGTPVGHVHGTTTAGTGFARRLLASARGSYEDLCHRLHAAGGGGGAEQQQQQQQQQGPPQPSKRVSCGSSCADDGDAGGKQRGVGGAGLSRHASKQQLAAAEQALQGEALSLLMVERLALLPLQGRTITKLIGLSCPLTLTMPANKEGSRAGGGWLGR